MKNTPEILKEIPLNHVINDLVPMIRQMASGRYAISIGGSIGKGTSDKRSDIDFRLFCDRSVISEPEGKNLLDGFYDRISEWRKKGIEIDGCWIRHIEDVDRALTKWVSGEAAPDELVWTIWGYYLPTDINNQHVIEDPFGIITGWKDLLSIYPDELKQSILMKHGDSLKYWRNDYHYRNKVERGDVVFLAGLSARLVHDMAQILFAVNEVYFVGDGWNLRYISGFQHKPTGFAERVEHILYPGNNQYEKQYLEICELIDEVLDFI